MDYILGRNRAEHVVRHRLRRGQRPQPASRWYAKQLDPALPAPPRRHPARRGQTSNIQDPYAQSKLQGWVAQFCFIDDIQSWSTNEHTINWNAALARMASLRGGPELTAPPPRPPPLRYRRDAALTCACLRVSTRAVPWEACQL